MATLQARIYSPRWGHEDTYYFDLTPESMTVRMPPRTATCTWRENLDPLWSGESLNRIFSNDSIYAPAVFQSLLEHLWAAWRNGELNEESAATELQEIIGWLNVITKAKPRTAFWKRYF